MTYNLDKVRITFAAVGVILAVAITGCNQSDQHSQDAETSDVASADDDEGFVKIFNGTDLEGWEGDTAYWSVENGNLVGQITPETLLKTNSFIVWRGGTTDDFELRTEFRITENGNSGINYRSEALSDIPNALKGYQADIDGKNNYTGQNYEERGRTTLAYRGEKVIVNGPPEGQQTGNLRDHVQRNAWTIREVTGSLGSPDSLKALIRSGDWNNCRIVARGNLLQHYINGVLMSEVTDNDEANRKLSGLLGVQVHVGPPMKVEYRNMRLKGL